MDLLSTLKLMDTVDSKLLIVSEENSYCGLVSVGDIQRAIIADTNLESEIGRILRPDNRVASTSTSRDAIRGMMLEFRTEFMPILDPEGNLHDVVFWDELIGEQAETFQRIDLPVVIMAGGKGTRLKPFSNVLPKPLFPLGERTILETILQRFSRHGCERFLISLNYKGSLIESYLNQAEDAPNGIRLYWETFPMGTAGSLQLMREAISETFFVSNCDILVDADYAEFLAFHQEQKNEISLIAAFKHLTIPYGTLTSGPGGQLTSIHEKPEITHLVNAGMYLLEPHLLDDIPTDQAYQITDLIEDVRARGGRVGVFPVSEKSWRDIGQWEEYGETLRSLGLNAR